MTDEQIKKDAERFASVYYHSYDSENNPQYLTVSEDSFIAGAHSRDGEIEILKHQLNNTSINLKIARAELDKLRNPWKNATKQLPPENKEGSNLSIDCVVLAGNGSSFFEVIAWYDYDGECWYEKYDFDQTHLDGNKVYYWTELPKCNHIETEGDNK